MPLTDAVLRSLKPTEKPRKVSDARGLYIELAPSGGKWWRLKYRIGGREKRVSLGTYPDVSLKEARERREEARSLLARGIDPSDHRKAVRSSDLPDSFEMVAREYVAKQSGVWAASHSGRLLRRLELKVFPYLGSRPIADISAPDVLGVVRRVEDRALETAHRVLRHCGQVFRYGIATGRCTRNVATDLRGALPPVPTRHFAATTEPKAFGSLLKTIYAEQASPAVTAALRLAPLVFVRPGELRQARWADVDLDTAEWRYVSSKGRAGKIKPQHIVPLSTQAVAILRELKPATEKSVYVFPSARSLKRPMSDAAVLVALRRLEIPADVMTGHGFRAVARTILDEVLGFRPDIIEHQLAHAVRDPNGRAYNRTAHIAERRVMMQAWSNYCDELREAKPPVQP